MINNLSLPTQTEQLAYLAPEADLWLHDRRLMSINLRAIPDQVRLMRLDKLGSLDNLPESKCQKRQKKKGIVDKEAENAPGHKCLVAESEDNYGQECGGGVSHVRLAPTAVRQRSAVNTLSFEGPVEEDVGYCHRQESDEASRSRERNEPIKTD